MNSPDFTAWTDAELSMTPPHIFGKHYPAVEAELKRRKNQGLDDGSKERVARLIKGNTSKTRRSLKRKERL